VAAEIHSGRTDPARRIAHLRDSLRRGNRLIAQKVAGLIPADSVVITLSNSSTVREALTACKPRGVYVMESNPGGEGAAMAMALRSALGGKVGHEIVDLIPDDSIGQYVPRCDCALVGIDTFDDSGSIWHKVGTRPLAELCREIGKPVYAAGHSLKRSDRRLQEIPPADSETDGQLFDWTPGNLITLLVTESG
jgi:translation initiation factor 2B subunit (eIF-2B alpha/beta/delta family)